MKVKTTYLLIDIHCCSIVQSNLLVLIKLWLSHEAECLVCLRLEVVVESEHGRRVPAAALPVGHVGGGGAGAGGLHFFLLLQPGAVNIRRLERLDS